MVYSIREEIEKGFPVELIKANLPSNDGRTLGELFAFSVGIGREDVAAEIAGRMGSFAYFIEQDAIKKAAQKDMKDVFEEAFRGESKGEGIAGYVLRAAVMDGRRDIARMIAKNMKANYWNNEAAAEAACHAAHMGWTDFFIAGHNGKDGGVQLGVYYALEAGKHQKWDTAHAIEMMTGIKASELKHG